MTVVEFWVEQYQTVVAEKKALGDKLRETLEENKDLKEQLDKLKERLTYTAIKNMETNIEDLQTRLNNFKASNEAIRSINSSMSRSLSSSMHQAQELKTQLEAEKEENESLHNVIDSFVDKCKELEDKAEGYKKKLELLNTVVTPDLDAQLKSMTERLDKSIADRSELQADRDIWFRKNSEKQAEIEELKKKIQSLEDDIEFKALCRDGWRDRAEIAERQLEEKKQQSYSNGYSDGNEEGQNELWEMLQTVKDMQPNEFDSECECLGDVIDMDLEDFLDAYKKWWEEKEKERLDHMRDYLARFCEGRHCKGCQLESNEFKCGYGYSFRKFADDDWKVIPDEELEKYYNKAWHGDATAKRVKEACDAFCEGLKAGLASEVKEVPVSCDIPIKDLTSWECTLEATVEINKDLLEKVCGVKDDKK